MSRIEAKWLTKAGGQSKYIGEFVRFEVMLAFASQ